MTRTEIYQLAVAIRNADACSHNDRLYRRDIVESIWKYLLKDNPYFTFEEFLKLCES